MVNRGWEYRRKLLARLDPRFASITRRGNDRPAIRRWRTTRCSTHYRSLFTGERATWLDVVRDPANRRRRAENQRRLMVDDRNIWLGDMTARDIGRMLEAIERETIASPASAATMRTFMRRQLAGSRRLPHFVDVPVAHKTGDSGNIANDVGIIYARSGPIVIAVMVTGITRLATAKPRIASAASPSSSSIISTARRRAPPASPAAAGPHEAGDPAAELQADAVAAVAGDPGRRHVVSVGQHRWRSGHGQLVNGGFEPEMRQIMSNVQTVLTAAGMTLADVVSVTAYLADMADFARFNEIYKEFFTSTPLPTRSTVAVQGLARGARLELTMTAVRSR